MPRITEEARQQRLAARNRVVWVLSNVFAGGQRRMAEALGVSQSQLSRISNGQLGPSPEILAAIARLQDLNTNWVMHGQGEPRVPSTRGTLPVSAVVLPGPPATCPHLCGGTRHVVADAFAGDSRYWLLLSGLSPLIAVAEWKLAAGDHLLMEASTEWTRRLDLILGKLCGVRLRPNSPTPYELGKLEQIDSNIVLRLGTVVLGTLMVTPPATPPESYGPLPVGVRAKREVRNLEKERARTLERQEKQRKEREVREAVGCPFTFDDIMCVCLYLVRLTPAAT